MNKKVTFILIIIIVILAGYFIFSGCCPNEEETNPEGVIEGSLSYPSEFIPPDMEVCAENTTTKEIYCTDEHIKDSKYTYGEGYKLEVPAGSYYVYATVQMLEGYKAYYSDFIACNLTPDCSSHEPVMVKVESGQIVSGIDPQDWYRKL